jgi:NTP pyrophosphatase (non-canonical NTP hydrolase)
VTKDFPPVYVHDPTKRRELYQKALNKWGSRSQMLQTMEECAELIQALSHWMRNRNTLMELAEEVADAEIMCEQMRLVLGGAAVDAAKEDKLQRLARRLHD